MVYLKDFRKNDFEKKNPKNSQKTADDKKMQYFCSDYKTTKEANAVRACGPAPLL